MQVKYSKNLVKNDFPTDFVLFFWQKEHKELYLIFLPLNVPI